MVLSGDASYPDEQIDDPRELWVRAHGPGLQLQRSLLWFDAPQCHDICLLSRYPRVRSPRFGTRVMSSPGVCRLIELFSGENVLRAAPIVSDYGRAFSIGPYSVEFLRAGCELGGASIYISSTRGDKAQTLLYATCPTPDTFSLVQKSELKKSHVLVLRSQLEDLNAAVVDKRAELARLADEIEAFYQSWGYFPTLVGPALGPLQEVMAFLHREHPTWQVSLPQRLHRIAGCYQNEGVALGTWGRWRKNSEHSEDRIPMAVLPTGRGGMGGMRGVISPGHFLIASHPRGLAEWKKRHSFDRHFMIPGESSLEDLKKTLEIVEPNKVVVTGAYIKHYLDTLAPLIPANKMVPVYPNNQPTLFDLMKDS